MKRQAFFWLVIPGPRRKCGVVILTTLDEKKRPLRRVINEFTRWWCSHGCKWTRIPRALARQWWRAAKASGVRCGPRTVDELELEIHSG